MIPKAIEGSTSRYIVSFTLEIPSILGDAKTINHQPFNGWRKTKGRESKHREVERNAVGALVENFPSCRRIFPTVTRQPLPNMKIEIAGNRCLGETKYEGNNVIKICVLSYFILKKIVIQRIDFKARFHSIELISIPFDFIYTLVDRSSMSV